ncbi:MAG: hypothetical protein WCG84_00085 [Candidatus Moraniibacteriota bacterium]
MTGPKILAKIKKFSATFFRWWLRHQWVVFLGVCFLVVVVGVWEGNHEVYLFRWTDDRKIEYRNENLKLIQFKESAFQQALDLVHKRQSEFSVQTGGSHDIFGAGKVHTP